MPEVSIITPTYNRGYVLSRAIDSALRQDYKDFEILIIDDGSKDNTKEIIKKYKDPRLVYIPHGINKGYPKAINTGFNNAKGKYIAFLDSDDEWLPEKLEKQINIFSEVSPEVGVVHTSAWIIENGKKMLLHAPTAILRYNNIHLELLKSNFIVNSSSLFKRECIGKVGGYNETILYAPDWEFWLRVSRFYGFEYINEPLVNYYVSPDSMFNVEIFHTSTKLIYEVFWDEIKKDRNLLSTYYYLSGITLPVGAGFKDKVSYFIKAIKTKPTNINLILKIILGLISKKLYYRILMLKLKKNYGKYYKNEKHPL